jgi:hypothetical protein
LSAYPAAPSFVSATGTALRLHDATRLSIYAS